MLFAMSTVATLADADSGSSSGGEVFVVVLGVAFFLMGVRWAFNIRGAADTQVARRQAGLRRRDQAAGVVGSAETDFFGLAFYRFVGAFMAFAGVFLLVCVLVLLML
ncbi:hypothetical protein GTW43_20115 [Streptomyces sp. SID5785]|uniref:hypothetical protein n=1 Tax=Streptomyces sp. SID5785 TaxID=2690309 RepID=UPI001360D4FC|nr:hypothetical protein [Streptomyces sp. SID5785]MZD07369.1 hypothetical protein [Streptomyces sp. SID5785]